MLALHSSREIREQSRIAPTMPANTAQSDPAEPLRTADLPLRHTENGASTKLRQLLLLRRRSSVGAGDPQSGRFAQNGQRGAGCWFCPRAAAFDSGVGVDIAAALHQGGHVTGPAGVAASGGWGSWPSDSSHRWSSVMKPCQRARPDLDRALKVGVGSNGGACRECVCVLPLHFAAVLCEARLFKAVWRVACAHSANFLGCARAFGCSGCVFC
jgi:hypothetical protein